MLDRLRGPLRDVVESSVLAPQARVGQLINQSVASELYSAHRAGTGRHGNILWGLLMLARWADRYLNPRTRPTHPCSPS